MSRRKSPAIHPATLSAIPQRSLSLLDEHRLRRRLRKIAPSETWVDAQIKTVTDEAQIVHRYHDPKPFPPGGRHHTAMKWCRLCGRYTPPNSIHLIEHCPNRTSPAHSASLHCDDCRISLDAETYKELHEAGLFLRPASSMSFVSKRQLLIDRMKG